MSSRTINYLIQTGKNIPPIYTRDTGLTKEIKNIIKQTLESPKNIPNVVIDGVSEFDGIIKPQLSPNHNSYPFANLHLLRTKIRHIFKKLQILRKQNLFGLSSSDRSRIFMKATDLLNNKYREEMLAYTIFEFTQIFI